MDIDYQFVILSCGIVTLFFAMVGFLTTIKLEISSLKRALNELNDSLKITLDKVEAKRDNDTKDLSLRIEAIYAKLDNLLWRFLNKQQ